mmetsp:Transcript_12335/g.12742  ORF Transcript_12335/g.12742 Transcript_12335/m.12742 type:complete len:552 (+) Transcript_12335:71-1726(+)
MTVTEGNENRRNEEVNQEENTSNKDIEPVKKRKEIKDLSPSEIFEKLVNYIKYIGSGILLGYCVAIVMTGNQEGKAVKGAGGIVLFWIFICYLSCIEGGQNALVGLQPIDPTTYEKTHKITALSTKLTRQPGYLEKFVMGRQLLTVIVVFAINSVGSISTGCSTAFNTSPAISEIFCGSGLALIFVTILLGQVTSQVITATCMLDFINNYIFAATTYVSVGIEFSGILHAVHFVSDVFQAISGQKREDEVPFTLLDHVLYWGRVLVSFLFLGFSLGCIIQEILKQHTNMWSGVPPGVSIFIFFALLCFVGIMEGLQIALFACVKMNLKGDQESTPDHPHHDEQTVNTQEITVGTGTSDVELGVEGEKKSTQNNNNNKPNNNKSNNNNGGQHGIALANLDLVFHGKNLKSFVVGRQICVTVCMFVVARISGINGNDKVFTDTDYTTFGISESFQNFVNTGIIGAFVTTILGSLIFRVIASKFPLLFLSNPLIYPVIHLCLLLESTGIIQFAKAMAKVLIFCFRLKSDHDYSLKQHQELKQVEEAEKHQNEAL